MLDSSNLKIDHDYITDLASRVLEKYRMPSEPHDYIPNNSKANKQRQCDVDYTESLVAVASNRLEDFAETMMRDCLNDTSRKGPPIFFCSEKPSKERDLGVVLLFEFWVTIAYWQNYVIVMPLVCFKQLQISVSFRQIQHLKGSRQDWLRGFVYYLPERRQVSHPLHEGCSRGPPADCHSQDEAALG